MARQSIITQIVRLSDEDSSKIILRFFYDDHLTFGIGPGLKSTWNSLWHSFWKNHFFLIWKYFRLERESGLRMGTWVLSSSQCQKSIWPMPVKGLLQQGTFHQHIFHLRNVSQLWKFWTFWAKCQWASVLRLFSLWCWLFSPCIQISLWTFNSSYTFTKK